jgi:predicted acylesterase/phospholipase RssA
MAALPGGGPLAHWMTMVSGLREFFSPNFGALLGSSWQLGSEHASHYMTDPLRKIIGELVDFDEINRHTMRISVGAANVCTGEMRYFDSRECEFTIDHVMASGALPPAFPAVRVEDHMKDIDFSGASIRSRWEAGYEHTRRAIEQAPWEAPTDPLEGVVLHQLSIDS